MKEFAPLEAKPLGVNPLIGVLCIPGKQTGSHESCFPLYKLWGKNEEKHGAVPINGT